MRLLHEIKKKIYMLSKSIFPCDCLKESSVDLHSNIHDFDASMGISSYYYERCMHAKKGTYTLATYPRPAKDLYNFLKSLYEKNHPSNILTNEKPKIPFITHMIWSGIAFPKKYHLFRKSWLEKQPHWTHIFWVDNQENYIFGDYLEDISSLKDDLLNGKYAGKTIVIDFRKLQLYNQKFYDCANNVGEKTDILKYELVYLFGGVYIDIDFECINALDVLNKKYDFYVGIQPLDETLALGAALFAGLPGDPILKYSIDTIKNDNHKKTVIERTGPIHFTQSFWTLAEKVPGKVIAFPASYFYPIGIRKKHLRRSQVLQLLKSESFALHHWAGSWIEE